MAPDSASSTPQAAAAAQGGASGPPPQDAQAAERPRKLKKRSGTSEGVEPKPEPKSAGGKKKKPAAKAKAKAAAAAAAQADGCGSECAGVDAAAAGEVCDAQGASSSSALEEVEEGGAASFAAVRGPPGGGDDDGGDDLGEANGGSAPSSAAGQGLVAGGLSSESVVESVPSKPEDAGAVQMSAWTGVAPDQCDGSNGRAAGAAAKSPVSPATVGGVAPSQRLPQLDDYNLDFSWGVYMVTFLFSAVRHVICNLLTASGLGGEASALNAVAKAVQSLGITFGAFWACQTLLGPRRRSQLIFLFVAWSTALYAIVFPFDSMAASLTAIPNVILALIIGMSWSQRGGLALALTMSFLASFVLLRATVGALPLLPEALCQLLVPALKTLCLGLITEVVTVLWEDMYKRPCSPACLTAVLMIASASVETVGVVGLLSAVDSENMWSYAAIFCLTSIVMETNSRSGILASLLYRLMGRTYRFSDAAHIVRWGRIWSSYSWLCAFISFVVPALICGLRVEDSNFTFLRREPWMLLVVYLVQQMATDFIYVYVQHYIRPTVPTLLDTARRLSALGQAVPLFGENERLLADGGGAAPEDCRGSGGGGGGAHRPRRQREEAFEPAGLGLGPVAIPVEALLLFLCFEYSASVWGGYVGSRFCAYGTFLPADAGSCD